MMMERSALGMPGMGTGGMMGTMPGQTAGMPGTMGSVMVPRCTMKLEKVSGGMKLVCSSDDKMAVSMMQNLCSMLQGSMCSCCCMMNGMTVCCCNLTMGMCKCDMTKDGVTMTCTSGDPKCAEMIQSCCECMSTMLKDGCTCCLMMNGMPVCCAC